MGGAPPPFWHIKNLYFYLWYEIETLQVVRLRLSRLAQKNFRDHVVYSTPEGDDNDVIGKRHL